MPDGLEAGDSIKGSDKFKWFRGERASVSPGERDVEINDLVSYLNDPTVLTGVGGDSTNTGDAISASETITTYNEARPVNVSTGGQTITLGGSPADGDTIILYDTSGTINTNPVAITDGGSFTHNLADNLGAVSIRYDGTSWAVISDNDTKFIYDTVTGEILAKPTGATIVAGLLKGGQASETFVGSPSNWSDAEANVDQGVSDWGNDLVLGADQFNSATPQTSDSSPYTLTSNRTTSFDIWNAFNATTVGGTDFWQGQWVVGQTTHVTLDLGVANDKTFKAVEIYGAFSATRCIKDFRILGSTTGVFAGEEDTLLTVTGLASVAGPTLSQGTRTFSSSGSYRYYRIVVDDNHGDAGNVGSGEIKFFEESYATTTNTFQHRILTAGSSTSFAPAAFAPKDESDSALLDGDILIEYSTDGSTWSTQEGLDAFKSRGAITSTTFWLRLEMVGAKRISEDSITTASSFATSDSSGLDVVINGSSIGGITDAGIVTPSFTTSERDAIATPTAGLTIYNTTTNKLNFYNGTAWEAVTSA